VAKICLKVAMKWEKAKLNPVKQKYRQLFFFFFYLFYVIQNQHQCYLFLTQWLKKLKIHATVKYIKILLYLNIFDENLFYS
jgi:hypothetical protein